MRHAIQAAAGLGLAALLALAAPRAEAATVTYSYTGQSFAVTSGPVPPSVTNLSGSFSVVQGSLFPPTTSADITALVTDFSFTDGNQTLTKQNTASYSFIVSLDAGGQLIGPWEITIGYPSSGIGFLTSVIDADQCQDVTRGAGDYLATIQCFSGVNNAGRWTGPTEDNTPVPVAPALSFFAPALLALGAVARRRRAA